MCFLLLLSFFVSFINRKSLTDDLLNGSHSFYIIEDLNDLNKKNIKNFHNVNTYQELLKLHKSSDSKIIGWFNDQIIIIEQVRINTTKITKESYNEVKKALQIKHSNIVNFLGLAGDPPNIGLCFEFIFRGSLRNVITNNLKDFKCLSPFSIMIDIVRGMKFLHQKFQIPHGRLSSSTCYVSLTLAIKIGNYGLNSFRTQPINDESEKYYQKLLWTAPEILKTLPFQGSLKGDVYSFAIIMYEVISDKYPYYGLFLKPKEIIECLSSKMVENLRPSTKNIVYNPFIVELMKSCWHTDPTMRPSFEEIENHLSEECMKRGISDDIEETLENRMMKYINSLELSLNNRKQFYKQENERLEELLYFQVPPSVRDKLKKDIFINNEYFKCVTLFFCDIAEFLIMMSLSTPIQIVIFLNDLYSWFDKIIQKFHVYKLETIGNAVLVVSGAPVRNGDEHALTIARMALYWKDAATHFRIRHLPKMQLKIKMAVHSGSCVAGLVSRKNLCYSVVGNSIDIVCKIGYSGLPSHIYITDTTKSILDQYDIFFTKPSNLVIVHAKKSFRTHCLIGSKQHSLKTKESFSTLLRSSPLHVENSTDMKNSEREFKNNYSPNRQLLHNFAINEMPPTTSPALFSKSGATVRSNIMTVNVGQTSKW